MDSAVETKLHVIFVPFEKTIFDLRKTWIRRVGDWTAVRKWALKMAAINFLGH